MNRLTRAVGLFLISLVTAGLYSVVVGLFSSPFRAPIMALPINMALFWFAFWKFKLLRFLGFIWAPPVALILFEIVRSSSHPGVVAERYMTPDRSHYIPVRLKAASNKTAVGPGMYGAGHDEILIGADGFRADPDTGRGNPERCRFVLIGDSMIYGSGLPHEYTLGPVLAEMGLSACVFGVTGNSPIDYLATAKYVAHRIDPGAYVAFYIYAYNDFATLNRYVNRKLLSLSNRFPRIYAWAWDFDRWRRATFTFNQFASRGASRDEPRSDDRVGSRERANMREYDLGQAAAIKVLHSRDPQDYRQPKPLNQRHRAALRFFLDDIRSLARSRSWHVAMVIHPDHTEIYANLARDSSFFVDLDPRRAAALEICKEYGFFCTDISGFLYQRAREEGKNPYFMDDRHFSIAGTRFVAENFVMQVKEARRASIAETNVAQHAK
jgi:hypothetical protein